MLALISLYCLWWLKTYSQDLKFTFCNDQIRSYIIVALLINLQIINLQLIFMI
jgi:hypothetical protein